MLKKSLASGFFAPHRLFLVCSRHNQSNSAFTTTAIEDTHLTVTVILFKVGAKNSLIISLLQTRKKKFAEFPFLSSLKFFALTLQNSNRTRASTSVNYLVINLWLSDQINPKRRQLYNKNIYNQHQIKSTTID